MEKCYIYLLIFIIDRVWLKLSGELEAVDLPLYAVRTLYRLIFAEKLPYAQLRRVKTL